MENKKKHRKKMVAPIVIGVLLAVYYVAITIVMLTVQEAMPLALRLVLILAPLALAGTMIYVLLERIKEIKGGEEDDLSQY